MSEMPPHGMISTGRSSAAARDLRKVVLPVPGGPTNSGLARGGWEDAAPAASDWQVVSTRAVWRVDPAPSFSRSRLRHAHWQERCAPEPGLCWEAWRDRPRGATRQIASRLRAVHDLRCWSLKVAGAKAPHRAWNAHLVGSLAGRNATLVI